MLLIDCVPVFSLNFMLHETVAHCEELALHRYGSNVIEPLKWRISLLFRAVSVIFGLVERRLGPRSRSMLVHFHPSQLCDMSSRLVEVAQQLVRSRCGSRVLQTLSEYGSSGCRERLIRQVMPCVAQCAMHRTASHVIRKLLELGDLRAQQLLAQALLEALRTNAVQVVNLACSRSGSHVLQLVSEMQAPEGLELREKLSEVGLSSIQRLFYAR